MLASSGVFRRGVGNVYTQIASFVYTQIAGVEFCVYTDCILVYKVGSGLEGGWVLRSSQAGESGSCVSRSSNAGCGSTKIEGWVGWHWMLASSGVFRRGVGNVYTQIASFVYTQIAGVEFCVYTDCILVYKVGSGLEGGWVLRSSQAGESGSCVSRSSNAGCGSTKIEGWVGWHWMLASSGVFRRGVGNVYTQIASFVYTQIAGVEFCVYTDCILVYKVGSGLEGGWVLRSSQAGESGSCVSRSSNAGCGSTKIEGWVGWHWMLASSGVFRRGVGNVYTQIASFVYTQIAGVEFCVYTDCILVYKVGSGLEGGWVLRSSQAGESGSCVSRSSNAGCGSTKIEGWVGWHWMLASSGVFRRGVGNVYTQIASFVYTQIAGVEFCVYTDCILVYKVGSGLEGGWVLRSSQAGESGSCVSRSSNAGCGSTKIEGWVGWHWMLASSGVFRRGVGNVYTQIASFVYTQIAGVEFCVYTDCILVYKVGSGLEGGWVLRSSQAGESGSCVSRSSNAGCGSTKIEGWVGWHWMLASSGVFRRGVGNVYTQIASFVYTQIAGVEFCVYTDCILVYKVGSGLEGGWVLRSSQAGESGSCVSRSSNAGCGSTKIEGWVGWHWMLASSGVFRRGVGNVYTQIASFVYTQIAGVEFCVYTDCILVYKVGSGLEGGWVLRSSQAGESGSCVSRSSNAGCGSTKIEGWVGWHWMLASSGVFRRGVGNVYTQIASFVYTQIAGVEFCVYTDCILVYKVGSGLEGGWVLRSSQAGESGSCVSRSSNAGCGSTKIEGWVGWHWMLASSGVFRRGVGNVYTQIASFVYTQIAGVEFCVYTDCILVYKVGSGLEGGWVLRSSQAGESGSCVSRSSNAGCGSTKIEGWVGWHWMLASSGVFRRGVGNVYTQIASFVYTQISGVEFCVYTDCILVYKVGSGLEGGWVLRSSQAGESGSCVSRSSNAGCGSTKIEGWVGWHWMLASSGVFRRGVGNVYTQIASFVYTQIAGVEFCVYTDCILVYKVGSGLEGGWVLRSSQAGESGSCVSRSSNAGCGSTKIEGWVGWHWMLASSGVFRRGVGNVYTQIASFVYTQIAGVEFCVYTDCILVYKVGSGLEGGWVLRSSQAGESGSCVSRSSNAGCGSTKIEGWVGWHWMLASSGVFRRGVGNVYTQIASFVYTQISGVEFCVYTDCILVYKVGSGLEGGWVLRSSQAGESGSCVSRSSNAGCGSTKIEGWVGWHWMLASSGVFRRGVGNVYTQIASFVYTQISGVEFCVYTDCILVYKVGSGLEGGWVLRSSQAGESGSCVSRSSNAGCGSTKIEGWVGWHWMLASSGVFRRGVGNVYTQIASFVYTQIAGVEFCVYTDCILVYKVGSGLEGGWVLRSSQAGESGSCVSRSSNAGCGSTKIEGWVGWHWMLASSGVFRRGVGNVYTQIASFVYTQIAVLCIHRSGLWWVLGGSVGWLRLWWAHRSGCLDRGVVPPGRTTPRGRVGGRGQQRL